MPRLTTIACVALIMLKYMCHEAGVRGAHGMPCSALNLRFAGRASIFSLFPPFLIIAMASVGPVTPTAISIDGVPLAAPYGDRSQKVAVLAALRAQCDWHGRIAWCMTDRSGGMCWTTFAGFTNYFSKKEDISLAWIEQITLDDGTQRSPRSTSPPQGSGKPGVTSEPLSPRPPKCVQMGPSRMRWTR